MKFLFAILESTLHKFRLIAIIPIIAFLFIAISAHGQKTWTGATSTDWNTTTNWSPSGVPSGTSVLIPGGLTNYPIITSAVSTVTTISVNSSGTGAKLTINTGGALKATGLITINTNGTFFMLNGTATLAGITNSGTMDVQGGTITSTVNLVVNGTLTQSGGTIWLATNTSTVPTDNLMISNGTVNQSGGLLATKNFAPTTGTFNQTGASAVFKIYRNWKPTTGHTFNSTAGTVQFSGASGNANFASINTQFKNILVDAGINPGFSKVVNSLVKISGNFTNNYTSLNNTTSTTFTFNGTGAQAISSAATGTNATFGHLVINNTGGTVSLSTNISAVATSANLTVKAGSVLNLGAFNFGPSRGPTGLIMEEGTTGASITGTTGILTLSGNLTVNATSGNNGANISANIALSTNSIFSVANDGTTATDLTVSGIISGAFTLTKNGTGTLVLAGSNTYTGLTTINTGTLKLGGNGGAINTPLGTSVAGTSIADGAVLDLNGFTLGAAEALTLNGSGISGNGVLTNTGVNASYSGAITLANNSTIAATTSGTMNLSGNISGNFTLSLGNDGDGTFSGAMSGTGSITKYGTGTWTLSGANTYTGNTNITAGTLRYGASNALGSGAITVNAGTLDMAGFSDVVGDVSLISGAITGTTGVLTGTSYDLRSGTVSAILAGTASLTKNSTGTVILSGVNIYTGVTTINSGILSVATIGNGGVAGNLGAAANTATNLVLSGGALQYTGATATTNRNYVLTAGTTSTIEVTTNTLTWSGASTNTTGALTKTGVGTLIFSGANLYTGLTSINEGTLTLGASNVISSGPIALNGGTFRTGTTTGNSETVGTLNVGGGSTLTMGTGVHTLNFSASNGVSWAGSALLTITGWTGAYNGTTGTAGKIFVGNSVTGLTAIQLSQIRFYNGSNYFKAIILNTGELVASAVPFVILAPPLALSYPTPNDFSKNAAITPLSPTVTGYVESYSISPALPAGLSMDILSGVISGTPTVLSSAMNYVATATNSLGSTTFTLSIAVNGQLATVGSGYWSSTTPNAPWPNGIVPSAADDVIIGAGHTITVDISTATCKSLTLGNANGIATLDFLTTGSPMLTVVGAVVVGGSGATNRLGTITFASGSTLTAATVNLGGNAATPAAGTINMTNGGNLIAGQLVVNTVTGNTWTPGTGTVRLMATNTLPATIFTTFANLQIDAAVTTTGVAISTTSLTVKAGATFSLAHVVTPTSVVLECGAAQGAIISGASALSLGGNITVNDAATGSSGATISAPISLGANRTFTIADDGTLATDLTISGIISGAFNPTKTGQGTLLLSGLNTYTGKTTISAGILAANTLQNVGGGASSLGAPSTVANGTIDISGTGTLEYTGTGHSSNRVVNLTGSGGTIDAAGSGTLILTGGVTGTNLGLVLTGTGAGIESGIIATGTGALTMQGDGLWTLSGVNTYTGATTINNGTLALGGSERISNSSALYVYGNFDLAGFSETVASLAGDGTVTSSVASASTLTTGNNSNTVFDGIIEDGDGISVSLVKVGNGTLTLSGDNTYSGSTSINAGTINIDLTDGAIPDLSAVVVTGTLDLFGYNEEIGSLAGAGTVTSSVAGAVLLTVGEDNTSTTFSGNIQNGTGTIGLAKIGTGALTLSGSNTYTGTTNITSGMLLLGAAERIANTSNIDLNGGTFKTGATTGFTETIGTLTLSSSSSIALGTGSHTLSFAASNGVSWSPCDTLIITGWQGGYNGTAGTAGKLKIGTTASGLAANQVVQIYFFNGSSYFAATILSTGEVVPLATAPIGPTPYLTGTTPGARCGPGTVILGATASYGNVSWYAADTGGTALGTGTSFTTPSIPSTTTYYAEASSNGCTATTRIAVLATVYTIPTITGTTPSTRCGTGTLTLGATASAGTINWYAAATGGSSLGTGTSFTTPSISTTTTYYVDATANGCSTASRTAVIATVNALPTITGTTNGATCGSGTVTLGATASAGTINWYAASTGGSSLATGTSFTTPSISTTTTYYVDATANGCTTASRTAVIATVNAIPTIIGTTPGTRCGTGTVTLGATASAGTINWYAASTGGSSLATGTSFTTPSISTTTTYYVDATANGCTTALRTAVIATVNAIPTITGTTPSTRCGTGTLTLGATASAGTINWYAASTGGSSLATGTSFTTPSISITTTYYVDATANGCVTATRTAVIATVNAIPTITGTTNGTTCGSGTVTLGATASAGTINWYAASTGGSSLATGTSFTTPSISTTTTYYVDATANGCITTSRTSVVATVNTIPTITGTTPGTRCGTGTVTLGATASAGTINWYAASTGGSSLATGTSFTTPSISSTTTYYVDATANGCTTASRTSVMATVVPNLAVSISIATPSNPACTDTIAVFTATPINPGTTPSYQWKVNGTNVGTNSTTYSYIPSNGDAVTCVLTSNATCASGSPATSNSLSMMVAICINKWKGNISNNWNTPGNWTRNYVPLADANIIFDDSPVNHCQLDQNRSVTNITNAQSTYRMVCNGNQLTIKGSLLFTNGAQIDAKATNSSIKYAGASLQTIDSTQYLDETIYNLTIDNTAGVSLNSSFMVTNNLTINSGKIFTIEPRKNLTVNGNIGNAAGNAGLLLKSTAIGTASLIHNTNSVPATVQRYISGNPEAWHFLSSPVSNQSISGTWTPSGTYGNGTGYDLYVWDEPTPCWVFNLNTTVAPTWPVKHPSANFVVGRGYLYSVQAANPTKAFIGNLNNGNINYAITSNSTNLPLKGFNLIGNPYPSSIDWKANTGWSRTNLVQTAGGYDMWIWNPAANNYGVINSAGIGAGTNGVTQYIAPMQGFYVRAGSNGDIGMTNNLRVHNGANLWFKPPGNLGKLKVHVASDVGNGFDEVLLQFGNATNEPGASKIFSPKETAPSLYMSHKGKDLSVRYLTDTEENPTVPLNFKPGASGDYTLNIEFDYDDLDFILLEDKKLDVFQNLKDSTLYQFKASVEDGADRFILHFAPLDAEHGDKLPANSYFDGNKIVLDLSLVADETEVKIVDALGRVVLNQDFDGNTIHRLAIDVKGQVFFVYATSRGKAMSRKVFVY